MAKTDITERIAAAEKRLQQLKEQAKRQEARRKSAEARQRRSLETKIKVLAGVAIMAIIKELSQSEGTALLNRLLSKLEPKDRAVFLQWPDFENLILKAEEK